MNCMHTFALHGRICPRRTATDAHCADSPAAVCPRVGHRVGFHGGILFALASVRACTRSRVSCCTAARSMSRAESVSSPEVTFSRGASCYCMFIFFACTVVVAIPLCINYSSDGAYWDLILVAVLASLFWSALLVAMYLRSREERDATSVNTQS